MSQAWRSAHDLLGDDAAHYSESWEWLYLFEESQPEPTLRDLVAMGLGPVEIAARLGITKSAARHAARRIRRGL